MGSTHYIAEVYADLIRKGVKTIDQVPMQIRPEVEEILGMRGDQNG